MVSKRKVGACNCSVAVTQDFCLCTFLLLLGVQKASQLMTVMGDVYLPPQTVKHIASVRDLTSEYVCKLVDLK